MVFDYFENDDTKLLYILFWEPTQAMEAGTLNGGFNWYEDKAEAFSAFERDVQVSQSLKLEGNAVHYHGVLPLYVPKEWDKDETTEYLDEYLHGQYPGPRQPIYTWHPEFETTAVEDDPKWRTTEYQ